MYFISLSSQLLFSLRQRFWQPSSSMFIIQQILPAFSLYVIASSQQFLTGRNIWRAITERMVGACTGQHIGISFQCEISEMWTENDFYSLMVVTFAASNAYFSSGQHTDTGHGQLLHFSTGSHHLIIAFRYRRYSFSFIFLIFLAFLSLLKIGPPQRNRREFSLHELLNIIVDFSWYISLDCFCISFRMEVSDMIAFIMYFWGFSIFSLLLSLRFLYFIYHFFLYISLSVTFIFSASRIFLNGLHWEMRLHATDDFFQAAFMPLVSDSISLLAVHISVVTWASFLSLYIFSFTGFFASRYMRSFHISEMILFSLHAFCFLLQPENIAVCFPLLHIVSSILFSAFIAHVSALHFDAGFLLHRPELSPHLHAAQILLLHASFADSFSLLQPGFLTRIAAPPVPAAGCRHW